MTHAYGSLEWWTVIHSQETALLISINGAPLCVPPVSVVLVFEGNWQLRKDLKYFRMLGTQLFSHRKGINKTAAAALQRWMAVEVVQHLIARRIIKVPNIDHPCKHLDMSMIWRMLLVLTPDLRVDLNHPQQYGQLQASMLSYSGQLTKLQVRVCNVFRCENIVFPSV